jgi:DNA polymerase-3 subunit alpha
MKFSGEEFYIKSTEEMAFLFRDHPEPMTNTRLVAEMCNLQMPKKEYHLPKFPCPDGMNETTTSSSACGKVPACATRDRIDTDKELRDRIDLRAQRHPEDGLRRLLPHRRRLHRHARNKGIPVGPGRGSAAGSVVAYCSSITQLCPLEPRPALRALPQPRPRLDARHRRRLLRRTPRRGDRIRPQEVRRGVRLPDRHLRNHEGQGRHPRRRPRDRRRASRRSIASPSSFPRVRRSPQSRARWIPELRNSVEAIRPRSASSTMRSVEGMVRHASTHAAGVVIATATLTDYLPLYKTPKEKWPDAVHMTQVEEIGLLKMDFLGIKNLSIIQRVENWLKERDEHRCRLGEAELQGRQDLRDAARGQTAGVFQLESPGMTALVKALKPTELRRPHRAHRALPPRPPQRRHAHRVRRPQAWPRRSPTTTRSSNPSCARATASSSTRNR